MFAEPITNVTVAVGREAALACVVENLGNHRVSSPLLQRCRLNKNSLDSSRIKVDL